MHFDKAGGYMDSTGLNERISFQLNAMSCRIDLITSSLYSNRQIANAHMGALEELLYIAQIQHALAAALASQEPEAELQRSPLEQVRLLALPVVQIVRQS
jgi:hypothetical protein